MGPPTAVYRQAGGLAEEAVRHTVLAIGSSQRAPKVQANPEVTRVLFLLLQKSHPTATFVGKRR